MKSPKNRLHSAMVVGATPAGVSAANKLGELGIAVTLVDNGIDLNQRLSDDAYRLPGGIPLNFAHRPGLIRILRNPGIKCILPAKVLGIRHNQQGFAVTIEREQTFVDPSRCTLCGRCVEVCPGQGEGSEKPIGFESRMVLPGRAVIDKRQEPLCQANCPLGVNAQGYIALARAGRYAKALELIRKDNVLPGICGRVCTHPCENACRRAEVDGPLAIRDIKRFLADVEAGQGNTETQQDHRPAPTRSETIAVVGSGPAGLAAAADLARQGFAVTVFEKEDQAGGLLRYGIGSHRLPRDIIDRELDVIQAMGVTIFTGHGIDLDGGLSDLTNRFSAVLLTVGSWADRRLGAPGEDLDGVHGCLSFLQDFYRGKIDGLNEDVAVIGDGNAAFDLARVLKRLGARVTLISWFPESMIPADAEEVDAALAEGITIVSSRQVTAFNGAGNRLQDLTLMPTRPGEPDAKGIHWPVIVDDGTASTLAVDRAFVAIGQSGAHAGIDGLLTATAHGYLAVDENGRTATSGIYAAGDAVTGASSVVQAMANGRQAAAMIFTDLTSELADFIAAKTLRPADRDFTAIDPAMPTCLRTPMPETPPGARQDSFQEVARGYDEKQVQLEAARCLQCSVCAECMECVEACGDIQAIRHDEPATRTTQNVGVLIVADPLLVPATRGEDVIRAYGPPTAKTDVLAMILRGQAAAARALVLFKGTTASPKGHGISFMPPDPGLQKTIRMGVFACRCNDSLGWSDGMDDYLKGLCQRPMITHAETLNAACTPAGIAHILAEVREQGLTRVVLASCVCCPLNFVCSSCTDQRSRLKEGLFNGTGISRSMVHTVNLRGEVLRLLKDDPELALQRFTGFLDRAIGHATNLLPFPTPARNYNFTTAVIGSQEAALTAATTLAEAGQDVLLFDGDGPADSMVADHPNVFRVTDATVTGISGTIGNFKIRTRSETMARSYSVGSIICGERNRSLALYRRHEGHPERTVHTTALDGAENGAPFLYPGMTSISGLFLADPPGVQISKRTKGAASAIQAAAAMPRGPRHSRGFSVKVKENLCRGCGRCLEVCPYQAIAFRPNDVGGYYAEVDDALCKGCGNCISVCPSDAADSPYRDHVYLEQTVERLLA
ncbi:4Fe-4S ferredoxin iron-sulfur protein [Desulfosarcina variabilis str. Montpellier]|uniref:FAD-dependent oxidoreductase n=1 Tax=Desulfosarcina variabilis TaxID=2300 RepID=UPI003AFA0F33